MVPLWLPIAGLLAASVPAGGSVSPAIWLTSRSTAADRPAGPLELRRAADGLFYVEGMVNGAPVRFLVDTGASMIVLTAADARRVGAASGLSNVVLKVDTASGVGAMTRVTLRSVRVGASVSGQVPAVVAGEGLAVSLLGQSWLSQLGSVLIEGDRMQLR